MIVFDTYAWIEFFEGTKKGSKVKKYINSDEEIITPSIVLAEFKNHLLRKKINPKEMKISINLILNSSVILDLNKEIALLAAEIKYNYKLYLIDAIVYANALFTKAKLLTGDQHFKKLDNVEFLS